MKKIVITILGLSLVSLLFGNEINKKQEYNYPFKDYYDVMEYVKDSGKPINFDLATKLNTDINWLKANEYLTDKKYKADTTSAVITKHDRTKVKNGKAVGTSEFLETYKGSRKFLSHYTVSKTVAKKVLVEFNKSIDFSGNPVSAHEGLNVIYNYFDNDNEIKKKYKKKFAEVLVKNDICWGYLVLGQMYQKGEYVTKDLKHALKIYEMGKPTCKRDVPKTWQHKHLLSGYYGLKRFIK